VNTLAGESGDDKTEGGLSLRAGDLLRKGCDNCLSYGSHNINLGKTENGKLSGFCALHDSYLTTLKFFCKFATK
jgi:hypothetical protein